MPNKKQIQSFIPIVIFEGHEFMNSTKPTYTSSSPGITSVWLSTRINHQQYGTSASNICFLSVSLGQWFPSCDL